VKANFLLGLYIFSLLYACVQIGAAADFQITKITKNLISAPDFSYGGG